MLRFYNGNSRLSLLVAVQPAALERTSPTSNRRTPTIAGSLGLPLRWLLYSVPAFVNLHDYYSIRIPGARVSKTDFPGGAPPFC